MAVYKIEITARDGTTETLTTDTTGDRPLASVDIAKTHTALADFEAVTPYAPELSEFAFGDVVISYGAETLFRGELESVRSDDDRSTTTISGRGRGRELLDGEATVSITNQPAHEAIADYWSNQTNFNATVITPTPTTTVTKTAQDLSTTTEFQNETSSVGSTTPLIIKNDTIQPAQTAFVDEAEDAISKTAASVSRSDFSGGSGITYNDGSDDALFAITTDYQIDNLTVYIRAEEISSGDFTLLEVYDDGSGEQYTGGINLDSSLGWVSTDLSGSFDGSYGFTLEPNRDLVNNGETYGEVDVDVVAFVDDRFSYTFDNSVDSNGYLSGPELYPAAATIPLDTVETPWNIGSADLTVELADSDETPAKLQAQLSGQTWFPNDGSEQNTESISTTFGDEVGSSIRGRVALGRRDETRSTATPTSGYLPQRLETWTLSYDGNDVAVIDQRTVEGSNLSNLQRLHEIAGMRFSVDHSTADPEVTSFRVGDGNQSLPTDLTVLNRTRRFEVSDYANEVTVRGAKTDGSRLTQTLRDDAEVGEIGVRHFDIIDPSLETQADVDAEARRILGEKLNERRETGRLDIAPVDVQPGFEYQLPLAADGSTIAAPIEQINYRESAGEAIGELESDLRTSRLSTRIATLRRDTGATRSSI